MRRLTFGLSILVLLTSVACGKESPSGPSGGSASGTQPTYTGSTQPTYTVGSFLSSVTAAGATGQQRTGSAPASTGGPSASVKALGEAASGGVNTILVQSSQPAMTAYVYVAGGAGSVGGYYELRLSSAQTTFMVQVHFAGSVPTSVFDVVVGVAATTGAVGPYVGVQQRLSSPGPSHGVSAQSLAGDWITEASRGYKIRITATSSSHFTAAYTNVADSSRFEGDVLSDRILVTQYHGSSVYGSYVFTSVSSSLLQGTLTDYAGGPYAVVWTKTQAASLTAYDLAGSWITDASRGYQIRVTATSATRFTAVYTNVNDSSTFVGELSSGRIVVTQYHGSSVYGTYTFTSVSATRLQGTLTDYAGGPYSVTWTKI